jgi:putative endopeptidase
LQYGGIRLKEIRTSLNISLLAVTVLLASCNNKEELVSGITKKNMNTLVKPGDNFDRFVNETWSKNNKISADKASFEACAPNHKKHHSRSC